MLVYKSVSLSYMYSASGFFCITAPVQSHVTDDLVYTTLFTGPTSHITVPVQPRVTDVVATALFMRLPGGIKASLLVPAIRCAFRYFISNPNAVP